MIGLERSWERARAVILELDGRSPAAEDRKATVPPATGRKLAPPVPTPARPTTKDRTGAQAKPTASSEAAIVAPRLPMGASFMQRPEDTGPAVDAALGDIGADRHADGPSGRSGMGLWDELAQAQSPERTRALVAMVASAAVASAGWTLGERGIRRRSVSIRLRRVASKCQPQRSVPADGLGFRKSCDAIGWIGMNPEHGPRSHSHWGKYHEK